MNGAEFRAALHSGKRLYGSSVSTASVTYFNQVKATGLDWVFIDNEHSPVSRDQTAWLCGAYGSAGIVPVVRVPSNLPHLATMAADGGAQAIICPYMEDPEVARAMVGAVKWRPLKGEKLARYLKDGTGLADETVEYLRNRNRNVSVILNIESIAAMERLDALCSVDGVDAIIIGPHDLSIQLDIPEQYDHPKFKDACISIIKTARGHGLGAGVHYSHGLEAHMHFIREAGANLIAHAGDHAFGPGALRRDLGYMRESFGDVVVAAGVAVVVEEEV